MPIRGGHAGFKYQGGVPIGQGADPGMLPFEFGVLAINFLTDGVEGGFVHGFTACGGAAA